VGGQAEREDVVGRLEQLGVAEHDRDALRRAQLVVRLRHEALDQGVGLGEGVDGGRGVALADPGVAEDRQRLGPPGVVVLVDVGEQLVGLGRGLLVEAQLEHGAGAGVVQIAHRRDVADLDREGQRRAGDPDGHVREAVRVVLVDPGRDVVIRSKRFPPDERAGCPSIVRHPHLLGPGRHCISLAILY